MKRRYHTYARPFAACQPRLVLLIVFLSWSTGSLFAQIPQDVPQAILDSVMVFDSTADLAPDTLILNRYTIDNLYQSQAPHGIALNNRQRQAEIARQGFIERAHLGNMGSAMRDLAYRGFSQIGLRTGVVGYEHWLWSSSRLSFYKQNQAVTDFDFRQTSNQQNIRFDASIARDVMPNLNFALEYRRINHLGQYTNQRNKFALINTGLWYHSPDDRLHSALIYTTNNIQSESNGGVTTDTLFEEDDRQVRTTIPVHLERAGIAILRRSLRWHTSYQLWRRETGDLRLTYDLQYLQDEHRFSDTEIDGESQFYKDLAVDTRGLRNMYRYRHWENGAGFRLNIDKGKTQSVLSGQLKHIFRKEDQQFLIETSAPIHLSGQWITTVSERYTLELDGTLGLNENRGTYTVSGRLQGEISPQIELALQARSGRYDPGWVYRSAYLSGLLVHSNDFDDTQQDHLGATVTALGGKVSFGAQLFRTRGFTYLDSSFVARQTSEDLFLQRLELRWRIPWRTLSWQGAAFVQNYDTPQYGMPGQYIKMGLTYQDYWFRDNLEVIWGIEARWTDQYELPGWQPALMSFYRQENAVAVDYIPIDLFFQFRIDSFRAFVQAENINDAMGGRIYYSVADHPMNEFLIRFGFQWQMLR